MDNCSDNLRDYVNWNVVTIIDWPYQYDNIGQWNQIQCAAYMHATTNFLASAKWCVFLDTDEFLFNPDGHDLKVVIKDYEQYSGICVNWVCYGTSHVEETDCILCDLVMRAKLDFSGNRHIKTICQPSKVSSCINPHFFFYKTGYAVNENKIQNDGPFCDFSANKLRINHYTVRDEKFLREVKMPRYKRWGGGISNEILEALNEEFDDCINRH